MPPRSFLRVPCIRALLHRLATKTGEKCGLAPIASRAGLIRRRERIASKIAAAGLSDSLDAEGFIAGRLALSLLSSIVCAAALDLPITAGAMLGWCLGWALATARLSGIAKRRRAAIELTLPGALDWLALSVEAGEGFAQALGRIADRLKPGPLREELSLLESSMRMGRPRREALAEMGRRASVPALSSFCTLLIQADILGGGIGPVLRALSARLRAERLARAERKGIAAEQRALLPLAIFIMPATFIVVFGPIVARLATGGLGALLGGQP